MKHETHVASNVKFGSRGLERFFLYLGGWKGLESARVRRAVKRASNIASLIVSFIERRFNVKKNLLRKLPI